ncbi:MAG: hypothetical protein HRU25_17465, partial [Psychrobium sp.]|nr:hypothetical protein [Psychrobium sp.]
MKKSLIAALVVGMFSTTAIAQQSDFLDTDKLAEKKAAMQEKMEAKKSLAM